MGFALGPSDPDVEENERKKTNPGHSHRLLAAGVLRTGGRYKLTLSGAGLLAGCSAGEPVCRVVDWEVEKKGCRLGSREEGLSGGERRDAGKMAGFLPGTYSSCEATAKIMERT